MTGRRRGGGDGNQRLVLVLAAASVLVVTVVATSLFMKREELSLLSWLKDGSTVKTAKPKSSMRRKKPRPTTTILRAQEPSPSPPKQSSGPPPLLPTDMYAKNGTHAPALSTTMPSWMLKHVQFQNQWLPLQLLPKNTTSSYAEHLMQFVRNNNKNNTTRPPLLVWKCPAKGVCGGLGDRLYGIIMGLYIAMLSNRLYFIEEWPSDNQNVVPHTLWDYVQPHYYHFLPWQQPVIDSSENDNAQQWTNFGTLSTVDNRQHPLLLDPCGLQADKRDSYLRNNIMTYESEFRSSSCLQDYWKQQQQQQGTQEGNDGDIRPLSHIGFWTLFRFTTRVDVQAQDLLRQSGIIRTRTTTTTTAKPPLYIGMHVRTGHGKTWDDPDRHAGIANLETFDTCAVALQRAVQQKCAAEANVYVAADQAHAKAVFLNTHSHDGTFKANMKMEVFHIDRSNTELLSDVATAYDNVWAELKVLIDSSCLVMSHSKFSTLAMELSFQQPRCAVYFDQCSDQDVVRAVSALSCAYY